MTLAFFASAHASLVRLAVLGALGCTGGGCQLPSASTVDQGSGPKEDAPALRDAGTPKQDFVVTLVTDGGPVELRGYAAELSVTEQQGSTTNALDSAYLTFFAANVDAGAYLGASLYPAPDDAGVLLRAADLTLTDQSFLSEGWEHQTHKSRSGTVSLQWKGGILSGQIAASMYGKLMPHLRASFRGPWKLSCYTNDAGPGEAPNTTQDESLSSRFCKQFQR